MARQTLCSLTLAAVAALGMAAQTEETKRPVRGLAGDLWADVIIGQPDFNEAVPHPVTASRVLNPGGVLVDRSVRPNRIYVYDGGNSRVLGFSRIGFCKDGPQKGKPGTCDSDFPGFGIVLVEGIGADLILGQPASHLASANRHGNYDTYPDWPPASATSLQTMPVDQISLTEGGSFANMAADDKGNLYVPDFGNHRVLRFNSPFETDTVADEVWGQPDLVSNLPNHGRGYGKPDASGLGSASACRWERLDPGRPGWPAGLARKHVVYDGAPRSDRHRLRRQRLPSLLDQRPEHLAVPGASPGAAARHRPVR